MNMYDITCTFTFHKSINQPQLAIDIEQVVYTTHD